MSSVSNFCNAPAEDAKHFFLHCPGFAALHEILFASTAHLLGDSWVWASDKRKTDCVLNGVPNIDFQLNVSFFHSVQPFIS